MDKRLKLLIIPIVLISLLVAASGCTSPTTSPAVSATPTPAPVTIRLGTTTSTYDSGLLDVLIPAFEKKYNVKVEILSKGSGEAIKLGETGDVDVLIVHSPAAEIAFMNASHGWNRTGFMHNDFVIVGPASDPAGIKGKNATDAFRAIYAANSTFVARGDNSGTSTKEKGIWNMTKLYPYNGNIAWYKSTGLGMADTLKMANEMSGYTLTDRSTYLAQRGNLTGLVILAEGGNDLANPYSIIAVNPEQHSNVNYAMAKNLIDFVSSAEGQAIIREFGKDKYGQPLFFPDIIK